MLGWLVDFLGCWEAWIVCIGSGKIVRWHGRGSTLVVIIKYVATVMLEAVAFYDLWIWHAFFGTLGSNNDINVLNNSNLFTEVLHGRAPEVQFMVNGNEYNMGYYLTDGIYPEWATFVKSVHRPLSAKDKLFAQKQEGARKDVECAFGVLQARFAILRNPARMWQSETLSQIMYVALYCII